MDFVKRTKELPQSNNYVYHTTDNIDIRTLNRKGINNDVESKKWIYLNKFLEQVANIENINIKPKYRGNCVFTYPRYAEVHDCKRTVIAIDLNKLNHNFYRASYHTVTEIYNNLNTQKNIHLLNKEDIDVENSDVYNMAVDYWKNMEKCSSTISKGGELLIDGPVKPESITHVCKF